MEQADILPAQLIPPHPSSSLNKCDDQDSSCCGGIPSRQVRFSASIDSHPHIGRKGYSQAEEAGCFYTKKETSRMKVKRNKLIKKIEQGRHKNKGSLRGLEYITKNTREDIDRRVVYVTHSVMDEQEDQMMAGVKDEHRLARASMEFSRESEMVAILRAQADMKAAWNLYQSLTHRTPSSSLSTTSKGTATTTALSSIVEGTQIPTASTRFNMLNEKGKDESESSEERIYPESSMSSMEGDECLSSTRNIFQNCKHATLLGDETLQGKRQDDAAEKQFLSYLFP